MLMLLLLDGGSLVLFPVVDGELLAGVGVAVFTHVGAGVILAYVFAFHASARSPLPFVPVVFLYDGISAILQDYGISRNLYRVDFIE